MSIYSLLTCHDNWPWQTDREQMECEPNDAD